MKLIDLLVQKTLSGNFKWPEKANKIHQDYDGELRPDYDFCNLYIKDIAENHRELGVPGFSLGDEFFVTREQYEAALSAAQQLVWNGEGLPPVGCECERSWAGDKWLQCKIIFVSDEIVLVKLATREAGYQLSDVKFRPLRSEADKKRETAINAILDDMRTIPCELDLRDEVAVIYDAIAAGKIPGVKLDV